MNKSFLCVATAALISTTGTQSILAEELDSLNQVVVTANFGGSELSKTGSSATIIDSEEIEKRKNSSLLELLRTAPGLEVVQTGSRGRQTSVFIRGNESDHTLLLIDGVRSNSNGDGAFDFADLKADSIEKIEIVRGPQSVVYGSEAIGGVINVITKKASEGPSAQAKAVGGSRGTQEYQAGIGWGADNVNTHLSATYFETDGISAAQSKNSNSEADGYENITLASRTSLKFLEDGNFDVTARFFRGETDLDGFAFGTGAVDDLNAVQEREFLTASATVFKSLTDWLTPTLSIGVVNEELEGKDPDTSFQNFSVKNKTLTAKGRFDITAIEHNKISLGYEFEKRETENVGNFDEEREVNSFFIQDQLSFADSFFLTLGARHDDDSEFGSETSYRATLAYLLKDCGSKLHASFGTAFKAPTFNELFFPNFGNPNLEAETSRGFDIGVESSFFEKALVLDVTYFQNNIDDLITFDTTTFLAENISEAETWGIESTASLLFWDWLTANLNYTFTDTENEQTGMELARRPRHRASATFFIEPIENLDIATSLLLVNHRRDTDGAKMDNYERVDLTVSYAFDNIEPFVRVENLFDESYEEIPSYGTPGFEIFAGVKITL